jgi:formylglycine-generating enzyme required for sulfatase activity
LAVYYQIDLTKWTVSIVGGNGYRLPTEAEWEYACRAGTTTPFHFGSTNNGEDANINGNSPYGTEAKGPNLERTTTVGTYAANAFGLYDMHGNTSEWCFDGYDETVYQVRTGTTSDPIETTVFDRRVLRGSSWSISAWVARSAYRGGNTPSNRSNLIGFRVARTP